MTSQRLILAKPYLGAASFVVVAAGLTIAVKPFFDGKTPLFLFIIAVILSAAYGGIRTGVAATVLSLGIVLSLPHVVLVMGESSLTFFTLISITAAVVIGKLRGLNAALRDARTDLERANEQLTLANEQLSRHTDALAHTNEELQQFAYAIAHDLRNPLRSVGGLTEILLSNNAPFDQQSRDCAGMIVSGVHRMESLLTSLLDYAGAATPNDEQVETDCNTVVQRVLADLHHAITTSNALITVDPLPTVPVSEHHLVRVFLNVIGNALKYRSLLQPIIHIAARDDGAHWLLSVRDNGIGFDMQHADDIFVMFKRLHHADRHEGNGVGLALCKVIIERYGGRIWAESQPGNESTFLFTLPKIQERDETQRVSVAAEEPVRTS